MIPRVKVDNYLRRDKTLQTIIPNDRIGNLLKREGRVLQRISDILVSDFIQFGSVFHQNSPGPLLLHE